MMDRQDHSHSRRHSAQGTRCRLPKQPSKSTHDFKYIDDTSSDFVYIRYTNQERVDSRNDFIIETKKDCLVSITNKLIQKERLYVLTLHSLFQELKAISTNVCNTLPLLGKILDFHMRTLMKDFFQSSSPLDIPNLFKKFESSLLLYVNFANSRKDFSYLVKDLNNVIVDHFKARLLEYNFTISQIKNMYLNNWRVKLICEEAEEVIKSVYRKIDDAMKQTDVED